MFAKSRQMAEVLLATAKQRVAELRSYPYSFLAALPLVSEEAFDFGGKTASLFTYRVTLSDGRVRVFVTASKRHLAGMVYSVNGDGFIVAPDGAISELTDEMRWGYL